MATQHCEIRFVRQAGSATTVSAALLRELLDTLVDAVMQSLRLRTEGRSNAPGTPPTWLVRASSFDIDTTKLTSSSLRLVAVPLVDAAPERFAQGELFLPIDPTKATALDVFVDALHDALESVTDSDRYDVTLLETMRQFGRVLRHVEAIDVVNGTTQRIDAGRIASLETLEKRIPAPQRALVAGKLDLLHHTGRAFVLILEDGTPLRGVFIGGQEDFDRLGGLWKQQVVVSGAVKFRPSGRVLRLEAEQVRTASERESAVLSQPPRAALLPLDERALHVSQGPRSGITTLMGAWPGDETEGQLEEALRTLS